MDNKRDPLSTYDINGGVKKNQYGARLQMDEKYTNQSAGAIKLRQDKIYQNGYQKFVPNTETKNRS